MILELPAMVGPAVPVDVGGIALVRPLPEVLITGGIVLSSPT